MVFSGCTMEPNQDEELYFNNLETRHQDAAHNHTAGGSWASYLYGEATKVGPAIAIPVSKGDTVRMEVWAQYLGTSNDETGIADLALAVATAFGGVQGGTELQDFLYTELNGAVGTVGLLGTDNDNVPNATLNYIFFDEGYAFPASPTLGKDYDFAAVTSAAAYTGWEKLALEKVADRKGYLYIYVANETPGNEVWFDDMLIVQKEHPVVQTDDYYPFGATFNGYVSGLKNRYQYQSKEFQEDLDLGMYDFGWRQYDPWNVTTTTGDPLAEKFYSYSPYSWTLNNPLKFIDPDGRKVVTPKPPAEEANEYRSLEEAGNGSVTFGGFAGVAEGDFVSGETASKKESESKETNSKTGPGWKAKKSKKRDLGKENPNSAITQPVQFLLFEIGRLGAAALELMDRMSKGSEFMLGPTAMVSGPERVALAIADDVAEGFVKHAFSKGRHNDLGLNVETITSHTLKLVEQHKSLLQVGDNTLIVDINGVTKSIKAFVKDGQIISINMYSGVSKRPTKGPVINIGEVSW